MNGYKRVLSGAVAATVLSAGLTATSFATGGLNGLKERIQENRVKDVITEDFNSSLYDAVKESTAYTSDVVEQAKEESSTKDDKGNSKDSKESKDSELKYYEHEVTEDDTLQDLAEEYNVNEEAIMEVNNMIDSDLHPGDIIYIPDSESQKKG